MSALSSRLSAYTTSIRDPFRSLLLAESNKRKKIFAKACVYPCCRYNLSAKIDINVTDDSASRVPYPLITGGGHRGRTHCCSS